MSGRFSAGRAPSQRQLRVGEELRHALADILRRGDYRDPELLALNVTVTEVRISPDLRNATAFVTPLGGPLAGQDMATAVAVLRRAAPFFRAQLAQAIRLRHAPTISFQADTSFDYAEQIGRILHHPDVLRDLAAETEVGAGTTVEAGQEAETETETETLPDPGADAETGHVSSKDESSR